MPTTTRPPTPPPVVLDVQSEPMTVERLERLTKAEMLDWIRAHPAEAEALAQQSQGAKKNGAPPSLVHRLTVRPATQADLPALQHLCKVCDLARGMSLQDFSPVPLVADLGGAVVGLIQVQIGRPASVVTLFGVLPEQRGSRAAFELVKAAELLMRIAGSPTWICMVDGAAADWRNTIEKYGATCTNDQIAVYRRDL